MDKPETNRERGSLLLPCSPGLPTPTGQGGRTQGEPHTSEANAETLLKGARSAGRRYLFNQTKPLPCRQSAHRLASAVERICPGNPLQPVGCPDPGERGCCITKNGHFIVGLPNAYSWTGHRIACAPRSNESSPPSCNGVRFDITFAWHLAPEQLGICPRTGPPHFMSIDVSVPWSPQGQSRR
jgi:hypothetical protein